MRDDFTSIQDRVITGFVWFVLGLISFSQHFFGMLSLAFTGDLKPGRGRVTSLIIKSMPKVIKIQKEEPATSIC